MVKLSPRPGALKSAATLALVVAIAGCASSWPAQRTTGAPLLAVVDTTLEGSFRWLSVDGKWAPQEMPGGAGSLLVDGSLVLRGSAAARSGSGGQMELLFNVRPPSDSARPMVQRGTFVVRGDTVLFTPSGGEASRPSRFRYAWQPEGRLLLTDALGHAWLYSRK